MAYKFQVGAAILSGSTTFKEGLSANDASISNVNDIAVDTISSDGDTMDIVLTDNQAAALEIKEDTNVYLKFVTTNGSEAVEVMQNMDVGSNDFSINKDKIKIGGTAVTTTAAELNHLDGIADATYNAAADSVVFFDADDSKLKYEGANDFASTLSGDGLAASSGVIAVQVSGAIAIKSDKVALSSSIAGAGLEIAAGDVDGVVSSLAFDLTNVSALGGTGLHQTADVFPFFDDGTLKKITFSNLEDAIFSSMDGASSDVAVAAGGAITLANNSVGVAEIATAIAGDGLTGGGGSALDVQVSGAIAIKSDKVALSSSVAGAGLEIAAGDVDGVVSSLAFDLTNVDEMTATIHQTADIFPIFDDGTLKKISFTNLEDEIFGNVSGDATIAGGGALTIANDAVEQAMIADDAVGADQLAANAVVNDSVASNAAIALSKIDTNVDMGGNFTIGNQADDTATFTGNLTVGGNLVVSGDTVTQNVANLTVEDPLIGLGYTDSATGSAGDRGLLLGLNGEQAPAMIWDESESQFAFVRTNSTLNATTVNINSYADLKVNSIEGSIVESITSGSNAAALSVGVNYFGDHGGAITANMPDNHSTVGQSVRVKAGSDCSATNKLTINAYGGQTIDGETEIVLESPFAAIEMVYVVSGSWRIF